MGSRWVQLRGVGPRVRGTGVGPCWWVQKGWPHGVCTRGGPGGRGRGQRVGPNGVRPRGRQEVGNRGEGGGGGPQVVGGSKVGGVGWWGPVGWAPGELEGGTGETPKRVGSKGLASGGWPREGGWEGPKGWALADGPWGWV